MSDNADRWVFHRLYKRPCIFLGSAAFIDIHTHTLASGHAYSTLEEMLQAGLDAGLKIMGITEHQAATSASFILHKKESMSGME